MTLRDEAYDLAIIGGGPAGYTAAIRAAQLGMRAALVESEQALGGTCLRVGCIPSKALLESSELYWEAQNGFKAHGVQVGELGLDLAAMQRRKDRIVQTLARGVDGLMRKNKVTRHLGRGRLDGKGRVVIDGESGESAIRAERTLLATGSRVVIPRGLELDGDRIGSSTEALAYDAVPRHLVVIGAGAIGLELGSVWRRLGAEVTVLELLDRILPGFDAEIAAEAKSLLAKQGLRFRLGARVTAARAEGDGCVVEVEGMEPIRCDRVLVAVGRAPFTEGLGLEEAGVELDERGRVRTGEGFATTAEGVYAIGDVIAGPMLAHKAEEDGVACVERLATGHGHVDYGTVPNVVYTSPGVAAVGRSEEELADEGRAFRRGVFPFAANGRARALGHAEGRVKVLACERTDRVLGVHIVGPRADDMIAEATAAMTFGASAEDIARTCHAHPTLPEVLREASLAALGRVIHM